MRAILCGWLFSRQALVYWLLFALIAAANVANVRFAVALNEWNGRFFNALQVVNAEAIYTALFDFIWLAGALIVMLVLTQYVKNRLLLSLRRDLTFKLIDVWLSPAAAHFQLRESGKEPDNPDQRIIEDSRSLVGLAVNLSLSLLESLLTIGSFSVILWNLSGSIIVLGFEIPGYMFWVCVCYTVFATVVTHWIGHPLKRLNFQAQAKEADLRYAFIEKRRHAEAIAGAHGEAVEADNLKQQLIDLLDVLIAFVKKQRDLDFFTVGLGQVTHLAPIFFSLPALLSGQIQLGGLMQIRGAFVDVARSFSWFIFAYDDLAKLAATWDRLSTLVNGLNVAEAQTRKNLARIRRSRDGSTDAAAVSADLALRLPDAERSTAVKLKAKAGDIAAVTGKSGVGKSTLLKTLAGFYGRYAGEIQTSGRLFWLPQKAYLFKGTLADNLTYPAGGSSGHDELRELLTAFDLSGFAGRLKEAADWTNILSGGEQQRIMLIRAVLSKPDILLLDEAISALDGEASVKALETLHDRLPDCAIVFVTHQECFKGLAGCTIQMR